MDWPPCCIRRSANDSTGKIELHTAEVCSTEALPETQDENATKTQAWYRDDSEENLDHPHMTDPPRFLTQSEIFDQTGVRLKAVEDCDDPEKQEALRKEGGYKYTDWLEVSPDVVNDERIRKLEQFYSEHLHKDDEVRLVTEGGAFFEIRDRDDKWIRIHVHKGDLLMLPAGIYHRFTLDPDNYIKMMRLFLKTPVWTSVNRPEGDCTSAREDYLTAQDSTPV